jgi:hypothetical protein
MVYTTHLILVISGIVYGCFNHISWFPGFSDSPQLQYGWMRIEPEISGECCHG